MKLLRVFPRRTNATPIDDMACIGDPGLFRPDADEVHISVAFTYDRAEGERLQKAWGQYYPVVRIGGPGMGERGETFTPGRYLKPGYVITSRGCPNRCWFCDVWKREGGIRELPITEGWNVIDDNLLACSERHITSVFAMLAKQPHRAAFTGGLEAERITQDIAGELQRLNPKPIFTAYDDTDKLDCIRSAGVNLQTAGFNYEIIRCYVLVGYPGDSFSNAERRLCDVYDAGFMPMAMLYRDDTGQRNPAWTRLAKLWTRPASIKGMIGGCKRPGEMQFNFTSEP